MTDLLRRVDAIAEGQAMGDVVPTGFASVDKALGGGIRRGDLVVLGGDVGSGKSALALAIGLRAAAERDVTFVSGEMTVARVMERALAMEGRAKIDDLRRGVVDEATRAAVGAAAVRLRDASPSVRTMPGSVQGLVDDLLAVPDLELAIVDPLQTLAGGAREQEEELAAAVTRLKALATQREIAVLVTAHLPHMIREGREDMRPRLDDFGVLGAVKQIADVVLGLYREEMYNPGFGVDGATELMILKNRNGSTGYVDLYFYKQWMRFEDMLDPDR